MSIETARSETAHGRTGPWIPLERESALPEAWRQVRHVLGVLQEVPMLWARPQSDRAHLAFRCCHNSRSLVSALIDGRRPFRVGLRVFDGTLLLLEPACAVLQSHTLLHRRLGEGRAWLLEHAEAMAGEPARNEPLLRTRADSHPLVRGGAFAVGIEPGLGALHRLWMNSDGLLRRLLVELGAGAAAAVEPSRSELVARLDDRELGVAALGLRAGDDPSEDAYCRVEEPHFFVDLGPDASELELPSLPAGRWIDGRGPRAVLPLERVLALQDGPGQESLVEDFWRAVWPE